MAIKIDYVAIIDILKIFIEQCNNQNYQKIYFLWKLRIHILIVRYIIGAFYYPNAKQLFAEFWAQNCDIRAEVNFKNIEKIYVSLCMYYIC